jgi:hypothetical protein
MTQTLIFDPQAYPERILRLVLKKANEWSCPPAEALTRLLDSLADQHAVAPKTEESAS